MDHVPECSCVCDHSDVFSDLMCTNMGEKRQQYQETIKISSEQKLNLISNKPSMNALKSPFFTIHISEFLKLSSKQKAAQVYS